MNEHAKHLAAALGGTVATVGLSQWSEVATIAAGFGTFIYGVSWAALAWLRYIKKPDSK